MGSDVCSTIGWVSKTVGSVELGARQQGCRTAPARCIVEDLVRAGDHKVNAGGAAARGHRLLIRTYWEMAKGAKMAMIATQQSTA